MKLKLKDLVILIILFVTCITIVFYGFNHTKESVQVKSNKYKTIYDTSLKSQQGEENQGWDESNGLVMFMESTAEKYYVTPGTTIYLDANDFNRSWSKNDPNSILGEFETSKESYNYNRFKKITVSSDANIGNTFSITCSQFWDSSKQCTVQFEIVWEENIKYFSNGSVYKSEMKPTKSKTVEWQLASTPTVPEGMIFGGWIDSNGNKVGDTGSKASLKYSTHDQTINVYAKWIPIECVVSFDSNTGTGNMENQTFTYGQDQKININTFEKEGYEFKGWAISADTSTVTYTDGQTVNNLSEIYGKQKTLYAVWDKIIEYTITYENLEGVSVNNPTIYKKTDGEVKLKDANKTGYIFKGWYTDSEFTKPITVLNTTTVTEDITIFARFELEYKIEYYYQNLENNEYKKDDSKSVTGTAKLGTKIETYDDKLEDGFEFKKVEPTTLIIAENSENIMKVYYDRILLEVTFEDTGDASIVPQNVKYGGKIEHPIEPERKGYEFLGWYIDSNGNSKFDADEEYDFEEKVTSSIILKAGWNEIKEYKIIYNLDGGTNSTENKTEYNKDDGTVALKSPYKMGYTFKGWYTDSNYQNKIEEIKVDDVIKLANSSREVLLYAKFEINKYKYKIEYYYQNIENDEYTINTKETIDNKEAVEYGKILNSEDYKKDAKDGFYYKGVDPLTQLIISEKEINNVIRFYYNREKISVSIKVPGSETQENQEIKYEGTVTKPENPTREGYIFKGWYLDEDKDGILNEDETKYDFNTPVKKPINIIAKWEAIKYSIKYSLNGGKIEGEYKKEITVEEEVTLPVPNKKGYNFDGWYKDGEKVQKLASILNDVELIAKWTPKDDTVYTIRYTYEGVTGEDEKVKVEKSTSTTDKELDITDSLNEPEGFEIDDEKSMLKATIKADGSTEFKVYYKRIKYEITFDSNGGNKILSKTLKYGESLKNNYTTPIKQGYTFDGWILDGKDYDTNSKIERNIKLLAKWKADNVDYKVEYYKENSEGEFLKIKTDILKAKSDEKVTIEPTSIDGYELDKENSEYLVSGVVKPDGSLTFKVFYKIKEYNVKYEIVKSGEGKEIIVKHGNTVKLEEQEMPEKQGYTFVGWITQDGELFNEEIPIIKDLELKLYYTPNTDTPFKVNYYKITDSKEYKLIGSNVYYGTTDALTEVELKNLVGYKVNAEKSKLEGKILADGSAVFDIYYDVDNPNIVETGDIVYILIAIIIILFVANSIITVKRKKNKKAKK